MQCPCRYGSDGFSVDKEALLAFGENLKVQIEELCEKIYGLVGYEFNLNSPKQLGKALFEDLMLTPKKKTKSGYSTSAEVLEELKYEHPAVELLLEYRQLSKLKSTYVDSMAAFIDENGRIHSTFNQTETRTGRISSAEPNLQNIPVRKAVGRELRRFFKAKEGCVLCDADYSQIELRVLAHMADDKTMIDTFLSGGDITHRNGRSGLRHAARGGYSPYAFARKGGEFRHCIRYRGIFAVARSVHFL